MTLDYAVIRFDNIFLKTRHGEKLRGYFASNYRDEEVLHNHKGETFLFTYPKVQYKVIKSLPIICGVNEGAQKILEVAFNLQEITIAGQRKEIFQKMIVKEKVDFGISGDYLGYIFVTPWIALNQKNIDLYRKSTGIRKEEMLKRMLIGNILSMSKGLGYTVDEQIHVWLDVEETSVLFKNIRMQAFTGRFKTNFMIPSFLGIGKAVSRGFGTIKAAIS